MIRAIFSLSRLSSQRYLFLRQLERIAGRKLSISERHAIIKACLKLIEKKKRIETQEDFQKQLARNRMQEEIYFRQAIHKFISEAS